MNNAQIVASALLVCVMFVATIMVIAQMIESRRKRKLVKAIVKLKDEAFAAHLELNLGFGFASEINEQLGAVRRETFALLNQGPFVSVAASDIYDHAALLVKLAQVQEHAGIVRSAQSRQTEIVMGWLRVRHLEYLELVSVLPQLRIKLRSHKDPMAKLFDRALEDVRRATLTAYENIGTVDASRAAEEAIRDFQYRLEDFHAYVDGAMAATSGDES